MMSSSSSSCNDGPDSDNETNQRNFIREDLSSMSFEEIMKLKEELGAKVYKEAILGVDDNSDKRHSKSGKNRSEFKRLNKNRPRELSTKRQVPFLGVELRSSKKNETVHRDPRFDETCGVYDTKTFKNNYKFLTKIRQKEIRLLKNKLKQTSDADGRLEINQAMQKLINKNVEDRKFDEQQKIIHEEKLEIQKARDEGRQPHFATKKELRAKELVTKFENLKSTGKLNKHLEKRRKKNAAKDRKKFSFD